MRRSSSGAPSRKVNGRPLRIPWDSGEGSDDSTVCTAMAPDSTFDHRSTRPSTERPSCRQSWTVWRTSTWSGTTAGPGEAFSWHAASEGHTAARRSSASIRWRWIGRRFPPRWRGRTRARFRFQRQRAANMGWGSTACVNTSAARSADSMDRTLVRGKLCWGPSESTTVSSSAAAWSSKSNDTQNRLRRARPRARLTRPPNGACTMSCVPSLSSKQRSTTMRWRVGRQPSAARPAAQ